MALQGSLDTFAIADVFGLLASTKKSGQIMVASQHEEGFVVLEHGEVVEIETPPTFRVGSMAEALTWFLLVEDGVFEFTPMSTPDDADGGHDLLEMLAESDKVCAELVDLMAGFASTDPFIAPAPIEGDEVTISRVQWDMLMKLGSGASMQALLDIVESGTVDGLRCLSALRDLGLIDVTDLDAPVADAFSDVDEGFEAITPGTLEFEEPFLSGYELESGLEAEELPPPPPSSVLAEFAPELIESAYEADHFDPTELAPPIPVVQAEPVIYDPADIAAAIGEQSAIATADDDKTDVNSEFDRGLLLKFLGSVND